MYTMSNIGIGTQYWQKWPLALGTQLNIELGSALVTS